MQYGNMVCQAVTFGLRLFKSYYVVWKHCKFPNTIKLHRIRFKSYYVVWKHQAQIILSHNDASLNRTMQYGNLYLHISPIGFFCLFKSYYVVWKLFGFLAINLDNAEFKSYYVVWKLVAGEIVFSKNECLNRTMQYGNLLCF